MPYTDLDAKREYMRNWRTKNPDKVKAAAERSIPKHREYRRQNLTKYAALQRAYRARSPRETLVNQARARAKRSGLPFGISVETLVWPTYCPILGIELDYNKTQPGQRVIRHGVPTLDRRINELGYAAGNVFVISHRANRLKSDATIDELESIARYMREHGG